MRRFFGTVAASLMLLSSTAAMAQGEDLYETGDTAYKDRNYDLAFEKFQAACALDNMDGCVSLATLYYRGRGVKTDRVKARELYQRGCDVEYFMACRNAELMTELIGDGG